MAFFSFYIAGFDPIYTTIYVLLYQHIALQKYTNTANTIPIFVRICICIKIYIYIYIYLSPTNVYLRWNCVISTLCNFTYFPFKFPNPSLLPLLTPSLPQVRWHSLPATSPLLALRKANCSFLRRPQEGRARERTQSEESWV